MFSVRRLLLLQSVQVIVLCSPSDILDVILLLDLPSRVVEACRSAASLSSSARRAVAADASAVVLELDRLLVFLLVQCSPVGQLVELVYFFSRESRR
eukprot:3163402-Amphidinium_carterae.1